VNPAICQQAMDNVGSGVAASLRAVDCAGYAMAQEAFGGLFSKHGVLLPALTILLTLYVAFFAFSLITGRSRISISALTPRMLTLGLVLTFTTSWVAYQGFVWTLAVGAPDQLASILTGVNGNATQVFAEKIDVVFAALVDSAGNGVNDATSTFSPPGLMWLGATLLLLGTVGILATCKIALAILLALGPVFVVLALFEATRGLFAGWLKGVVLMAITPLFAVLGGSLMLDLSVPVLRMLAQTPGQIDPKAAMAFFLIGAVHVALMVLVLKVAGTMVAGWSVFGITGTVMLEGDMRSSGGQASERPAPAPVAAAALEQARAVAPAASREIRLARAAPAAANDAGPAGGPGRRDSKVVAGAFTPGAAQSTSSPLSRARGIGSRFRAPAQKTATARPLEKLK
jgi:type IV secretion system protein VirB6